MPSPQRLKSKAAPVQLNAADAKAQRDKAKAQIEWKKQNTKGHWRKLIVKNERDAARMLKATGIDTSAWNQKGCKSLSFLLDEVQKGMCDLQTTSQTNEMEKGSQIRRHMRVAKVKVMRGNQILVEAKQLQLVSCKVKMDEEATDAATRALKDRLGSLMANAKVGRKIEVHHESKYAPSYPGLLGYSEYYTMECDGFDLPDENFTSIDEKTGMEHEWTWIPMEEWNRIAKEKLRLREQGIVDQDETLHETVTPSLQVLSPNTVGSAHDTANDHSFEEKQKEAPAEQPSDIMNENDGTDAIDDEGTTARAQLADWVQETLRKAAQSARSITLARMDSQATGLTSPPPKDSPLNDASVTTPHQQQQRSVPTWTNIDVNNIGDRHKGSDQHFMSVKQHVIDQLKRAGVPIHKWGTGKAKSVDVLIQDLLMRHCGLEHNGGVPRGSGGVANAVSGLNRTSSTSDVNDATADQSLGGIHELQIRKRCIVARVCILNGGRVLVKMQVGHQKKAQSAGYNNADNDSEVWRLPTVHVPIQSDVGREAAAHLRKQLHGVLRDEFESSLPVMQGDAVTSESTNDVSSNTQRRSALTRGREKTTIKASFPGLATVTEYVTIELDGAALPSTSFTTGDALATDDSIARDSEIDKATADMTPTSTKPQLQWSWINRDEFQAITTAQSAAGAANTTSQSPVNLKSLSQPKAPPNGNDDHDGNGNVSASAHIITPLQPPMDPFGAGALASDASGKKRRSSQSSLKDRAPGGPLFEAAAQGDVGTVMSILKAGGTGADSDARGDGATPLYAAAANGHTECAQLLMKRGANVNASITATTSGSCGATPLYAAASNGHVEVVKSLLAHPNNANVHLGLLSDGTTPLHVAAFLGHSSIVEAIASSEQCGVSSINRAREDGSTPLHLAAAVGNAACVKTLLGHLGDAEAIDEDGATPLFVAAKAGFTGVLALLLPLSDVHALTYAGNTPLHIASMGDHIRTCGVLLQAGADRDFKRAHDDKTAIDVANTVETADFLRNFGRPMEERLMELEHEIAEKNKLLREQLAAHRNTLLELEETKLSYSQLVGEAKGSEDALKKSQDEATQAKKEVANLRQRVQDQDMILSGERFKAKSLQTEVRKLTADYDDASAKLRSASMQLSTAMDTQHRLQARVDKLEEVVKSQRASLLVFSTRAKMASGAHAKQQSLLEQTERSGHERVHAAASNTVTQLTAALTYLDNMERALGEPTDSSTLLKPQDVEISNKVLLWSQFGEVRAASWLSQPVAVKPLVTAPRGDDESANSEREREKAQRLMLHAMCRLQHPNVLHCFGGWLDTDPTTDKKRLFVVTVPPNATLREVLAASQVSTKLTLREQIHVCIGVASGLAYLHDRLMPWVLGALSIDTVCIDENFNARITDIDACSVAAFSIRAGLVDQAQVAPELSGNRPPAPDAKSDCYSLGVLLAQTITGITKLAPKESGTKMLIGAIYDQSLRQIVTRLFYKDRKQRSSAAMTVLSLAERKASLADDTPMRHVTRLAGANGVVLSAPGQAPNDGVGSRGSRDAGRSGGMSPGSTGVSPEGQKSSSMSMGMSMGVGGGVGMGVSDNGQSPGGSGRNSKEALMQHMSQIGSVAVSAAKAKKNYVRHL